MNNEKEIQERDGQIQKTGATNIKLSPNGKEAKFVEAAPYRPRQRGTRIIDGQLLTITQNSRGHLRVNTKAVDPRDFPNYAFVLYCEATDAMNKIIGK